MKEYVLGLYEKAMPKELSWKEKLLAAKEAGYDFVEISIAGHARGGAAFSRSADGRDRNPYPYDVPERTPEISAWKQ